MRRVCKVCKVCKVHKVESQKKMLSNMLIHKLAKAQDLYQKSFLPGARPSGIEVVMTVDDIPHKNGMITEPFVCLEWLFEEERLYKEEKNRNSKLI